MAELVDKLFERYGVAVLGFDVVWAERDPSSGIEVLDALRARADARRDFQTRYAKLRPGLDFDAPLRREPEGPAGGARLLLQHRGARGQGERAAAAGAAERRVRRTAASFFHALDAATPATCRCTSRAPPAPGTSIRCVDFDGVLRRVPLLVEYDGAVLRGAVARHGAHAGSRARPARRAAGRARLPAGRPATWSGSSVGGAADPGRRERGRADPLPRRAAELSATSRSPTCCSDRVAPERAEGQDRPHRHHRARRCRTCAPTPVGGAFPGVEIHANLIAGILDGEVKQRPLLRGRRRGRAAAHRRASRFAFLIPRLSALWATLATRARHRADRRVQLRGLAGADWCCRSPPRC